MSRALMIAKLLRVPAAFVVCAGMAAGQDLVVEKAEFSGIQAVPATAVPGQDTPQAVPSTPPSTAPVASPGQADPKAAAPQPPAAPAKTEAKVESSAESRSSSRSGPSTMYVPRTARNGGPAKEISFSFDKMDWPDFLRWLADQTGRTLFMTSTPSGQFSYWDKKKYTINDGIDIVNDVLQSKGFTLVLRDNFIYVVGETTNISNLVQKVTPEELASRPRTDLVKVVLTLEGRIAKTTVEEFKDYISKPFGSMLAIPTSNQVVIVDTVRNIQQIIDLIKGEGIDFKFWHLKHVPVREAERVVRNMLGLPPVETAAAAATAAQPQAGGRGNSRGGRPDFRSLMMGPQGFQMPNAQPPGQQPQVPATPPTGSTTEVAVDDRNNTLFVTATPNLLARVESIIKVLDTPSRDDDPEGAASRTPYIDSYQVSAGSAEGLAPVLASMFENAADVKISAHPDGRAVIVLASARDHKRVKEVLAQFKTEGLKMEVYPLRRMDAETAATLVKSLFGQVEKEDESNRGFGRLRFFGYGYGNESEEEKKNYGPMIAADPDRQRLLVRGTEAQLAEIRGLLSLMGEPGITGVGIDRGRFRNIPVSQMDPNEVAERMQKFQQAWKLLQTNSDLNIQVLGDPEPPAAPDLRRPPRESVAPPASAPRNSTAPESKDEKASTTRTSYYEPASDDGPIILVSGQEEVAEPKATAPAPRRPLRRTVPFIEPRRAQQTAEKKALGEPKPARSDETAVEMNTGRGKVTILIGPENISVVGDDPDALDIAESLLEQFFGREPDINPSSPRLQVYQLKYADASTTAYDLDEVLYPQRSFFDDPDPDQARITADTRTNRLLVVGPVNEQKKVKQLLDILDVDEETPEHLASKPRTIPVKHAKAADIATMVRYTYGIPDPAQPGQNQGGGGGGGFTGFNSGRRGTSSSVRGKIMIAVDDVSNAIIVQASQKDFDEVQALVADLDKSAGSTKRVARGVALKNANPASVQKALSLLGVKAPAKDDNQAKQPDRNNMQQNDNNGGGRFEFGGRGRDRDRGGRGGFFGF